MESRVDLNYVRNMFSLENKVAIVTGGAGALGQAIAQGLAVYGADVVVTGRTLKSLFTTHITQLAQGLPESEGRNLLIAFLARYYRTRVEKHQQQKLKGGYAWAVYE